MICNVKTQIVTCFLFWYLFIATTKVMPHEFWRMWWPTTHVCDFIILPGQVWSSLIFRSYNESILTWSWKTYNLCSEGYFTRPWLIKQILGPSQPVGVNYGLGSIGCPTKCLWLHKFCAPAIKLHCLGICYQHVHRPKSLLFLLFATFLYILYKGCLFNKWKDLEFPLIAE